MTYRPETRAALADAGTVRQDAAGSDFEPIGLRVVGDICPGDTAVLGLGVCSTTRRHGVSFPFAGVASLLDGADVLVGNLEGILSKHVESTARTDLTFCGQPALAGELRRLGFTGLTVANNHTFEHGVEYFRETVKILRDAGLEVFGLRDPSGEFHCRPVVLQVRGRKVGILAYNWVSVDRFPAADAFIAQVHHGAVNYTWHRDPARDRSRRLQLAECNTEVCSDIRRLRSTVDHVVLLPHWGFEYVHVPPYGCVLEGRAFVEAGADVVVGTHPHVLQGYERHLNGVVFFSTGNFLFDHFRRTPRPGAVLTVDLGGTSHGRSRFDFTAQNSSCQITGAAPRRAAASARVLESSNRAIASPGIEGTLDDDIVYAAFERQYRRAKVRAIWTHIRLSMRHPFVARVVAGKVRSLVELVVRRLRGERVRW